MFQWNCIYIEYKILFIFNTLSHHKKSLIFQLYIYSNIIMRFLLIVEKKSVLIEKYAIEFHILFFCRYLLCNKQNVYKLAKHWSIYIIISIPIVLRQINFLKFENLLKEFATFN